MNTKTKPTTYTHPEALPPAQVVAYRREWQALEDAYCERMKPFDAARDAAREWHYEPLGDAAYILHAVAVEYYGTIFREREAQLQAKYNIVPSKFIPR